MRNIYFYKPNKKKNDIESHLTKTQLNITLAVECRNIVGSFEWKFLFFSGSVSFLNVKGATCRNFSFHSSLFFAATLLWQDSGNSRFKEFREPEDIFVESVDVRRIGPSDPLIFHVVFLKKL